MPSIGSILSIARTAISAQQAAIATVSHNIANAETEGYSRQRVELMPGDPVRFTYGSFGSGVQIQSVTRARSELLDANYHREAGASEGTGLRRDILSQIQDIFGEPGTTGLTGALDAFWNSWSDLANNPGNATAQNAVRQYGAQVAQSLNSFDTQLNQIAANTRSQLASSVSQLNALSSQVADLNVRILAAESGGKQAPDLRDARDRLTDQMAKVGGTRAILQNDGTVAVTLGGTTLVDQSVARVLQVNAAVSGTTISLTTNTEPLVQLGGTLEASLTVLNGDIPAVRTRLDTLAKGVVNGVNYLHEEGWTAAGDALGVGNWTPPARTGSMVDFFDPAGTSAATIKLSAAVQANAGVIASGTTQNAPGDNSLALALGALRDGVGLSALQTKMGGAFSTQVGLAAGESYDDHYRQTVTDLGLQVASAEAEADVHETLASQADARRQSMSGVSTDEELTLLMRFQQAFVAASRLAQVADDMAQAVLDMV
jgi:flagellar hook-associated protein 1 FlgK